MSSARGNIGEFLVMADLLHQGFDTYLGNRDNPAFDVACWWNLTNCSSRLRVKTTSNSSAIWTVKKSGGLFLDVKEDGDFVAIVDIANGTKDRSTYVVPTTEIIERLDIDYAHYVSHPQKNGKPRKMEQGMRCMRFYGEDKPDNQGFAYHQKFEHYLDAWDQLK